MASRQEVAAVYTAAVVQGMVLVTFPAVTAIFMSADHYGLSNDEYGGMFTPQAVMAILSSLLGAGLTAKIGGKSVFLIGLAADLLSMLLLFASQFATSNHPLAYDLLLAATACLGVGFGFAVPALNTFTAAFFPTKVDQSILTLNALLGTGTALAPIVASIFLGIGYWWGLPLMMSGLTLALIIFSLGLPLQDGKSAGLAEKISAPKLKIPARFWLYAAFALLYGIGETMNANWASVYMSKGLGASATLASIALTTFWISVTVGRVFFAVFEKWCPPRIVYRALPALMVLAFVATASVPAAQPFLGVLAFGLAGLSCSALLPLVISFAQEELTTMTAAVAGGMIGFYQMGYGIATFGGGRLQSAAGLSLAGIFRGSALVALVLTVIAFLIIARPRPVPAPAVAAT